MMSAMNMALTNISSYEILMKLWTIIQNAINELIP